jgi:glycerate kinase
LILCAPASLKGVLDATDAAAALAEGAGGLALPIADGGEGTAEVLYATLGGEWREADVEDPLGRQIRARWLALPDGRAVVESAAAAGLPLLAPEELDPLRASTRGLGLLVAAILAERPTGLLVTLGGVATVDGGAGLRKVVRRVDVPLTVVCDVRTVLDDAPRVFGPQKGATADGVAELERRLRADPALRPYADLEGSGAAGGLGAALASLGGRLVRGAPFVLETVAFRERLRDASIVVTGEGTVDATTALGKAPGEAAAEARAAGVRCVVFGGLVREPLPGVETVALSGDPARAREDLVALGRRLAA